MPKILRLSVNLLSKWTRLDQQVLGIALALLAYSLLAIQDATVKWLVVTLPVWQVLFVRSAILVVGSLAVGGRPLVHHAFTTPTIPLLVFRGLITLTAWFCYFTAARELPLGQLTTLFFTAPVIVTMLAAPLLGEKVGRIRWTAVSIGFTGSVLVASPAGLSLSLPTVLALLAAGLWGYGVILTRKIACKERSVVQIFFNNCFFLVMTGVGCIITWRPLTMIDILLLLQVAILGGFGQLSLFESARRAPASLTAPFEYIALIWAFTLGLLIWGDVPRPSIFLGACLILAAGAGLLIAERWPTRRLTNTAS